MIARTIRKTSGTKTIAVSDLGFHLSELRLADDASPTEITRVASLLARTYDAALDIAGETRGSLYGMSHTVMDDDATIVVSLHTD